VPPYPNRLGVFPLADVVLFPHAHLPLHVLQSRHHALISDALARDGRFVLAVIRPGEECDPPGCPAVHSVACSARIVSHQRLNDDVSDVILRGERVVRIRGIEQVEPYRVARLEVAAPELPAEAPRDAEARLKELRELIERCCPGAFGRLLPSLHHAPEEDGGLELLNTLAACLPVCVELKLDWLKCESPRARWTELRGTLLRLGEARDRRGRVLQLYEDLRPGEPHRN
jgi:Lon protease-like protein